MASYYFFLISGHMVHQTTIRYPHSMSCQSTPVGKEWFHGVRIYFLVSSLSSNNFSKCCHFGVILCIATNLNQSVVNYRWSVWLLTNSGLFMGGHGSASAMRISFPGLFMVAYDRATALGISFLLLLMGVHDRSSNIGISFQGFIYGSL